MDFLNQNINSREFNVNRIFCEWNRNRSLHLRGANPVPIGQENAALARARALCLRGRRIQTTKNWESTIGFHSARQGSMSLGRRIGRAVPVARERTLAQGTNATASVD